MKKQHAKKALAVVLSAAMTFSLSAASNMMTAPAASSVNLNTTFKTLKAGQKNYKLKLKNNKIGWKIKTVTSSNKTVCAAYGKTSSYVLLKGKSEGRATIKITAKTAKRKKYNKKTLRCRVKVAAAATPTPTPTPTPDPTPEVKTSANVKTQADLDKALADDNIKTITIESGAEKLVIAAKAPKQALAVNASNVNAYSKALIVDASTTSIENHGTFQSISIKAVKDWTEKAVGNKLSVDGAKADITVADGADVYDLTVTYANANVKLTVNGTGKVASLAVNAKASVDISGTAAAKFPVTIASAAGGTDLTSAISVDITAASNATITLKDNAKDSTVNIVNSSAVVTIKNRTSNSIKVTKADNTTVYVTMNNDFTSSSTVSNLPGGNFGGGGNIGGGSGTTTETKITTVSRLLTEAKKASGETTLTFEPTTKAVINADDAYKNVNLIVNAPNADIENHAVFKSITIKSIKGDTWHEFGKGNSFTVNALKKVHIAVAKGAKVASINFEEAKEEVVLDVAADASVDVVSCGAVGVVTLKSEGTISNVAVVTTGDSLNKVTLNVAAKTKDNIAKIVVAAKNVALKITNILTGSEKPASIPVTIDEGSDGKISLESNAPVAVQANTKADITLTEGAENSTVKLGDGVAANVDNKTTETIVVTDSANTETPVESNKKQEIISKVIKVSGIDSAMNVGASAQLTAEAAGLEDGSKTITWKSTDPTKADVDQTGKVTAKAAGKVTIIAHIEGYEDGKIEITVNKVKVTLDVTEKALKAKETLTLKASVTGAEDTAVTWASSDESVATVDQDGKVTAVAAGTAGTASTATITATSNADKNAKASCEITVSEETAEDPAEPTEITVSITKGVSITTDKALAISTGAITFSNTSAKITGITVVSDSSISITESNGIYNTANNAIADDATSVTIKVNFDANSKSYTVNLDVKLSNNEQLETVNGTATEVKSTPTPSSLQTKSLGSRIGIRALFMSLLNLFR